MRSSKGKKRSKFLQVIVAPIKILGKARKLYMTGIQSCASRVDQGVAIGCPSGPVVMQMPKGFNVNSFKECDSDVEFSQVLRATSTRNLGSKLKEMRKTAALQTNTGTDRSYSFGVGKIGKIDEDQPCAFEGDGSKADDIHLSYTRSHVVNRNFVYQL